MSPTKRKELEEVVYRKLLEVSKLSAIHHAGKGNGLLSHKLEAEADDLTRFFDLYLQEEVEQAEIKAFDDGYDAGRNATPPSLRAAVEFRQEQYGWNDSKMAAMLDLSKAHYSEFKHGKRNLPVNSIRKAYAIGIPAEVLLHDQLTPPQQPVKEDVS